MTQPPRTVFTGALLHCLDADHTVFHPDGVLIVEAGYLVAAGDRHAHASLIDTCARVTPVEGLIVPGFVDAHVHYPQLDIIGHHGKSLLDWLEHYTFPAELAFADAHHAHAVTVRFLDALATCGTTTAAVYGSVHAHSVDCFFAECARRGLRMIAGKALMDRHAPDGLRDPPGGGIDDTRRLIADWHGRGRLQVAITPRFAPSCSPAQLAAAGHLLRHHEGVLMQTHLAETLQELAWAQTLFPASPHYTSVYDEYGLLGERSLMGHGIHLTEPEWNLLAQRRAKVIHCPSSNLFLGSGLFDLAGARRQGVHIALGSDVGAGTSLSMLDTAGDAYRVSALRHSPLGPHTLLYLITLAGAQALHLDHCIGNFLPGKEADFCALRLPPQTRPTNVQQALDAVFHLAITHQGQQSVTQTWIMGVPQRP